VRWLKTRRTTGIAQTVRRRGKTTAGDLQRGPSAQLDPSGGTKVRQPQGQLVPVLQDNAAGRETVDFTGPRERCSVRILSGCMQSWRASAQRCNEEIFEGSVAATHFIEALTAPSASHTLL
ncbi:hypothetical protein A4X13_0g9574, partial [Tilletia indica]